MSLSGLRKEDRYGSLADAVASIETFAEQTQQRHVRIQASASSPEGAEEQDNVVAVECDNAPECKWFVRLSYIKTEKKWKISSMNTMHHRTLCTESKRAMTAAAVAAAMGPSSVQFQRLLQEDPSTSTTNMTNTNSAQMLVGMTFGSWKEAISAIRTLAHHMGRRAVAGKSSPLTRDDGKVVSVRRVVCQNRRNSNCEWMVVLEESQAVVDQFVVTSVHLLHSKECLETCNFSARAAKKEPLIKASGILPMPLPVDNDGLGHGQSAAEGLAVAQSSASLLVDDISKYQLTHEMRWSTGKDATKAISDFALVVQRKRSKLCKKNNGGSNKKYVCSDEKCLWFVQLVKGWKSKNWKISAMNLKHSENCTGQAKPTARQLAEMRFFRQAVITHSKSSGKLLTDNFLMNAETGIKIPRGMAYRAQRLVVMSSTDDLTESYKFIPSLLDSFARKNVGSMVSYEKDDHGHFVRAFLMPNASCLALLCMQQVYGIKVIQYDNVSYNGCLVLLIGKDGNLKSQVLAFALMPNGEMEHMKWFLSLAKAGGVRFDGCPVFCSHNQNGLLRALAHEARNAKIMFCVQSLIDEMQRDKNIPTLGGLDELVWDMQRQDTEEGFMKILAQLEGLNAAAAAFIRAVHPKNWAGYLNRSIRLYKWSTTGADEAIDGSDIQTTDEAPFDMMYSFLAFLMDFNFKKSQLATKLLSETPLLTPGADAIYRHELQESRQFTVRLCDEQVAFTWRTGARPKITHRVDLSLRTCTCGQMYQVGIPCCHFIAVSMHFGNETTLMDGFDSIYKAATYAEVNRTLRIEIPAAEDLHKDASILPALSTKGAKYKKRPRPTSDDEEDDEEETNGPPQDENHTTAAAAVAMGTMPTPPHGTTTSELMGPGPIAKAARLEFDSDVVSGLTELV